VRPTARAESNRCMKTGTKTEISCPAPSIPCYRHIYLQRSAALSELSDMLLLASCNLAAELLSPIFGSKFSLELEAQGNELKHHKRRKPELKCSG